ncbi:hypothetical protein T484DRAFT_3157298 [Baffinella frigidus]|nr:hypothetical protein T484DRAFT_3157298 [Cryptophyta sp. CCMP2293]
MTDMDQIKGLTTDKIREKASSEQGVEQRRALLVRFTLRSSQYATMCIRELLKEYSEEAAFGIRQLPGDAAAATDAAAKDAAAPDAAAPAATPAAADAGATPAVAAAAVTAAVEAAVEAAGEVDEAPGGPGRVGAP